MTRRAHITNLILVLLASIAFGLSLKIANPTVISISPDGSPASQPATKGKIGDTEWSQLRLYATSGPWAAVMLGLATGFVTLVIVEWLKAINEQFHVEKNEKRFIDLFGPNSLSRNERGRIIIQSDRVEHLLNGLAASQQSRNDVTAALATKHNNRLYKARTWVNARDALGARVVREGFRADKFPTPELHIIEHPSNDDPFKAHSSAPYIVSMGLAWTDTTTNLAKDPSVNEGKFYIEPSSAEGDAISIRGDLLPASSPLIDIVETSQNLPPNTHPGEKYFNVFPKPWSHTDWLDRRDGVNDYAVIVRHTADFGRRQQVRFILAGFTEDGTVAAARYLVNRQDELHKEFKKSKENGNGDFVVIISGPANATDVWGSKPVIAFSKGRPT